MLQSSAQRIPIQVVDMGAYRASRRGNDERVPERIVGILTILLERAHKAASIAVRDELLRTITHLTVSFGPTRSPQTQLRAIRFCVDECARLLEVHEPSVERDEAVRAEASFLLGIAK